MKNFNIQKILVAAVALILVAGAIFYACEKMNKQEEVEVAKSRKSSMVTIGEQHNQLCEYLLQRVPLSEGTLNTAWLTSLCTISKDFMLEQGFADDEVDIAIKQAVSFFESFGDNPHTGRSRFIEQMLSSDSLLSTMLATCGNSDAFNNYLLEFYNFTLDMNTNRDAASEYVASINSLPDEALKNVFIDVYLHSDGFWQPSQNLSLMGCPPNGISCARWTIFMDALGALYGTAAFGTVGGILVGAAFSDAAQKECEACGCDNKQ